MATKKTELSIRIRAIDKATLPIRALSARIAQLTAPIRAFGAGIIGGFKGVGSAMSGVFGAVKSIGSAIGSVLSKVPLIGGIIVGTAGAAVAGLMALVNHYDELGDKAEEAGVSVDFLAQMRYAAEKSGASVEQLDAGLKGFVTSLGQARAGTGRMAGFLNKVSPALLKQLKAAKSTEEAFGLLGDSMLKIKDPAKRAAFAQKALGDASLAPLLKRGSKGIKELRDRYLELAGSQKEAAEKSGEVDDSMKDLKASTDGIKAALVTGLAPALKVIVVRLREWLVSHRGDIAKWAAEFGAKLPGAIRSVVAWVEQAIGKLKVFLGVLSDIYDKVDALWNAEENREARKMRERRAAFYGGAGPDDLFSEAYRASRTPEEAAKDAANESLAQYKIKQEDELRARIQAQAEGKNWVEDGDEKFGDTSKRKTVYSPEELRALVGNIGVGVASRGAENLGLITQALTTAERKRANVSGQARADVSGQARHALATQRATETKNEITVKFENALRGMRVAANPANPDDVNFSVGYQMFPGMP